ncbi:cell division protein ZipA [Marinomonas sp. NPDC078689]|jgi:cell division protein ZipA|uniref:cell division protein ZipA n=1 Tax=Marinomonas sp. NPDC078689 TaxID=3364147 RepID=UPI0037CCB50B
MEFSLREWLILIGVVIIVAILIDGFRRYKKGQQFSQDDDDDDFVDPEELAREAMVRRELPNGGARPVGEAKRQTSNPITNAFENARQTVNAPLADLPHKVDSGPTLERDENLHLDELASLVPDREEDSGRYTEQNYADEPLDEYQSETRNDEFDDLDIGHDDVHETADDTDYERDYSSVDVDQITPQGNGYDLDESDSDNDDAAEIEEVIVINIFAPEGKTFSGIELLQLVLNCGMRFGDMDIFHRHEEGFDRGRVQFSMANAIEPGTFDLDTMGEGDCPGVSFFMGLPGPKNSMKAFDFMLETAQALVRNLGGELRDERRSPMSEQTIAHCRQRIRDFERRRLMKHKP